MRLLRLAAAATALSGLSFAAHAAFIITSASGADAAAIGASVAAFRGAIGGAVNPPGSPGPSPGRREINWDGVPDARSAPNDLPLDFFNVNSARGAVFSTPGSGVQVSADASNPTSTPVEFGHINPTYPQLFATFSAERLFTALGSNVVDVAFFVPGTPTPATTNAFGAVFTDVDLAGATTLQVFFLMAGSGPSADQTFVVPEAAGDQTLSFLGVLADAGERITRVRITSGNEALSAAAPSGDVVAMDDFIYAEPLALVPEPATAALLAAGVALLAGRRRPAGSAGPAAA